MTSHLAVALDGDSFDAADWVAQVRLADEAGLDLVTFEDSFGRRGPDAVLVASRVAPLTRHVGLVPVATTTHTEPFHLSTALATLDHVSHGRAGWQVRVSADPAEAALLGRRAPLGFDELFAEAADAVEVVRRLWDSWADDAIIKDVATGRFIDRDKLHYIDFAGPYFAVKGPSIVPRPPQGQPVVAALAHGPRVWQRLDADVYFTTPADADAAARIVRQIPAGRKVFADLVAFLDDDQRTAIGRRGAAISDAAVFAGTPAGLADLIAAWQPAGLAGFRLWPGDPAHDLPAITRELVPELRRRGLFQPSAATTLRDRLGLPAAVNRYEGAARA
ncbi:LLM class flavin-dependent oxidoreductase [Actinoplanes teichomyceticus]|uniref:Alkanesulfonate monooxygenase SsuD/methylene tetrahydromethanopterin reductase-like flavin-dependent oxidoreductase (Luciferase family) n=1 Tax=Actinoplanes teichomyceticus TaxID=1867 RepID=A0A561WL84_ACTTI|nr:LLM class flavin-dependent oxidoreductase [Actinoplanes teichomyceticus]TWG24619.1 alkanesulfonate monooxygenase SsuD/methylene tetrahydromethanopterin reductase-like flavin-dependent oxidoreductase (luciferase family) [Actinoplanes teichomyceticus]GIF14718.1 FMNH2-utilizing oxygenase [Actinoplanes teichomyceticus]